MSSPCSFQLSSGPALGTDKIRIASGSRTGEQERIKPQGLEVFSPDRSRRKLIGPSEGWMAFLSEQHLPLATWKWGKELRQQKWLLGTPLSSGLAVPLCLKPSAPGAGVKAEGRCRALAVLVSSATWGERSIGESCLPQP